MRTAFSYYGGKGILAKKYPVPIHKRIVEPFAGGAAYSLRYYRHDVVLIELNKKVVDAWNFIKNPDFDQLAKIPVHIDPGTKISDFLPVDPGFEFILRAAANVGTGGQNKKMETVTSIGARHFFNNTVKKIKFWTGRIQHWKIIHGNFDEFRYKESTYFIDPPYQNKAGRMYKFSSDLIDFERLKKYVASLSGQIIIAENSESKWIKDFSVNNLGVCCGVNAKHISNNRQKEVFIHFYKKEG
jgi:site-specific DNA-adenine methylase